MRLADESSVVGLDIGSETVRAVVLDVDDDGHQDVLGFGEAGSSGIVEGVVVDVAAVSQSVSRCLAQARRSCGFNFQNVVLGLSGKHIASLNARGTSAITRPSRRIQIEDLYRVRDQARVIVIPPDREIVQILPRFYRIDGQGRIESPVGMRATRLELEAHIITGSSAHVQNLHQSVIDAGYSVRDLFFSGIASAEAVLTTDQKQNGVIHADIGYGTTDITIIRDGAIAYTSVIPLGGSHITKDISARFSKTIAQAERVKLSRGECCRDCHLAYSLANANASDIDQEGVDSGELFELVYCRVNELGHHIRVELIKSGFYNLLSSGLVLTGGGSRLRGISTVLGDVLRVPAVVRQSTLQVRRHKFAEVSGYTAALGLAQAAMKNDEMLFSSRHRMSSGPRKMLDLLMNTLRQYFD